MMVTGTDARVSITEGSSLVRLAPNNSISFSTTPSRTTVMLTHIVKLEPG